MKKHTKHPKVFSNVSISTENSLGFFPYNTWKQLSVQTRSVSNQLQVCLTMMRDFHMDMTPFACRDLLCIDGWDVFFDESFSLSHAKVQYSVTFIRL